MITSQRFFLLTSINTFVITHDYPLSSKSQLDFSMLLSQAFFISYAILFISVLTLGLTTYKTHAIFGMRVIHTHMQIILVPMSLGSNLVSRHRPPIITGSVSQYRQYFYQSQGTPNSKWSEL